MPIEKNCPNRGKNCSIKYCSEFKEETCNKLLKPPYVCNGCKYKSSCTLAKKIYRSEYAQNEYSDNLIDSGLLRIRNIDLPRKVRYRNRKKQKTTYRVDKECLNGRRYSDYLKYIQENPDTAIVEMDSVEGEKGGKVLLTLHFVSSSFMLAFIRNNNDSQSVIDIFNDIQRKIGLELFRKLFPIILTDNGSEFSNPKKIEYDNNGNQRTKIFYCEPGRPDQKGSCEVNHEMIRKIFKKGESFDDYS